MWKAEIALFDGLPLNEWLWVGGVLTVIVLAIYLIGQLVKIRRRKI
jgi:hypothetical protein